MLARQIMGDGGKAAEKGSASPQTIGLLSNLVVSLPFQSHSDKKRRARHILAVGGNS
jgi:hypothetical protein